jgi:glycosyltransferase involved in cell wall biosynthesis
MNLPLVSIIIPTYNSEQVINACLKSIAEQNYKNIELIVVDNNSTDNTKQIAQNYTQLVYNIGPERSAQRNCGSQTSKGDYLLIIDSDMELSNGVVEACVAHIKSNEQLKMLTIPEESFGETFWSACKKLERSFYTGIAWQETARFFLREVYREFGGYDESFTGFEDYDLPNRIEYKYGAKCIGSIQEYIYHNEQNLSLKKLCQKKFYYAKTLGKYIKKKENQQRLSQQTSVLHRYGIFLSRPGKLFKNPFLGLGVLFMKTCEFTSGAVGLLLGSLTKKA